MRHTPGVRPDPLAVLRGHASPVSCVCALAPGAASRIGSGGQSGGFESGFEGGDAHPTAKVGAVYGHLTVVSGDADGVVLVHAGPAVVASWRAPSGTGGVVAVAPVHSLVLAQTRHTRVFVLRLTEESAGHGHGEQMGDTTTRLSCIGELDVATGEVSFCRMATARLTDAESIVVLPGAETGSAAVYRVLPDLTCHSLGVIAAPDAGALTCVRLASLPRADSALALVCGHDDGSVRVHAFPSPRCACVLRVLPATVTAVDAAFERGGTAADVLEIVAAGPHRDVVRVRLDCSAVFPVAGVETPSGIGGADGAVCESAQSVGPECDPSDQTQIGPLADSASTLSGSRPATPNIPQARGDAQMGWESSVGCVPMEIVRSVCAANDGFSDVVLLRSSPVRAVSAGWDGRLRLFAPDMAMLAVLPAHADAAAALCVADLRPDAIRDPRRPARTHALLVLSASRDGLACVFSIDAILSGA